MRILIAIISILLFGRAISELRKKITIIGVGEILVWASVVVLSIFPETAHKISDYLNFGENLNTLIFLGFVVVFVILFKILESIERVKKDISDVAMTVSVKEFNGRAKNQ